LIAFPRLIRFAKVTALVADLWTISYIVLVGGWQTYVFLSAGDWPALPVKSVLEKSTNGRAIYEVAATRGIGGNHSPNPFEALLQLPAIVPLLFAAVLLTIFYLWLSHIEKKQHLKN
jgi:hypothetical protein